MSREESELEKKVLQWINKQGYPLELYTASVFRRFGFRTANSVYYKDKETDKSREVDVIAYNYKMANEVFIHLAMVVECKWSKNKPWVVFDHTDVYPSVDYVRETYTTMNGKYLIDKLLDKYSPSELLLIGKEKGKTGFTVTQALTSGNDIPYQALNGVTKATEYFISQSNNSEKKICTIYFPVIVMEGNLFKAHLNEQEQIEVQEVDEVDFTWVRSYDSHRIARLTILTKSHLEKFVEKFANNCDQFFEKYKEEIFEMVKNMPVNRS